MKEPKYKRILLKLSGESLSTDGEVIDSNILGQYAAEIKKVHDLGVEVAIVIGGGNIFRGASAAKAGIDRVQGDYMGMLATVINGMAVQASLEKQGLYTRMMTAIKVEAVCEPFIRRRAMRHLEKGRIVIFGAGTGNPYFTTDSGAALRAAEMKCDALFKGTSVDGVYDADPKIVPTAKRYDRVGFDTVLSDNLKVMDASAVALCRDNDIPIVVFSIRQEGNLARVLAGEGTATIVSNNA